MLQTASSRTNPPPIIAAAPRPRRKRQASRTKSPLDVIDANIAPIAPALNARAQIEHLVADNNVRALITLYDSYIAAAQGFLLHENQPRAKGTTAFLNDEYCQMISRAYLVADRLKTLTPNSIEVEEFARVLFDCTLLMGNNIKDAVAVAKHIGAMRLSEVTDRAISREPTTQTATRLEAFAAEYDALANQLLNEHLDNAIESVLADRVLQIHNEACLLSASSKADVAFLAMMASSELDRIFNGNEPCYREAAKLRLDRFLFGVMDYARAEADAVIPAVRQYLAPDRCDPRHNDKVLLALVKRER